MSATPSPWRRVEPPGGRPYYYNKATRAVLWSLPPDVAAEEVKTVHQRKVPAVEAGFGVPGGPSPAAAAKCTLAALLQELEGDCTPTARAWGTGMPRRTIAPMAAAGEVWEARHAASQGLEEGEIYYVNRVTGESVWERPPGFGEAEGPLAGAPPSADCDDCATGRCTTLCMCIMLVAALERAFPSSWTVCECVCRVGLDRVRPLASALHGDSATDVTPLFTALTTLAFLLQRESECAVSCALVVLGMASVWLCLRRCVCVLRQTVVLYRSGQKLFLCAMLRFLVGSYSAGLRYATTFFDCCEGCAMCLAVSVCELFLLYCFHVSCAPVFLSHGCCPHSCRPSHCVRVWLRCSPQCVRSIPLSPFAL